MLPGRGIESELVSSSGFELSGGTLILKDFFFFIEHNCTQGTQYISPLRYFCVCLVSQFSTLVNYLAVSFCLI